MKLYEKKPQKWNYNFQITQLTPNTLVLRSYYIDRFTNVEFNTYMKFKRSEDVSENVQKSLSKVWYCLQSEWESADTVHLVASPICDNFCQYWRIKYSFGDWESYLTLTSYALKHNLDPGGGVVVLQNKGLEISSNGKFIYSLNAIDNSIVKNYEILVLSENEVILKRIKPE